MNDELTITIRRARICIDRLRYLRDNSNNGDIIHTINGRLSYFSSLVRLVQDGKGEFYSKSTDIKYDLSYLKIHCEKIEKYLENIARRY